MKLEREKEREVGQEILKEERVEREGKMRERDKCFLCENSDQDKAQKAHINWGKTLFF